MAAGSRQPLITMIYGSWFQTATYDYGLWQLGPDSHSKLWAVAVGSSQILYRLKVWNPVSICILVIVKHKYYVPWWL